MKKEIQLFQLKLFFLVLMGVFFCTFAGDILTVHAMQSQEEQTICEEQVPLSEEPKEPNETEESVAGAFLLIGGFIIIIMAVLIAVISTFVSTAAISDEL